MSERERNEATSFVRSLEPIIFCCRSKSNSARWRRTRKRTKMMRRTLRLIRENIAIAESALPGSFSEEELELVAQAAAKYKELMQVNCTGCGYCMPCTEGVLIPWIFEVYNKMHLFGNTEEAKYMYAVRMSGVISGDKPGFASECVQCGECLEKCPQNIAIPDELETIVGEMEGADLEDRITFVTKMLRGGQE